MMSLSGDRASDYANSSRLLVFALGFILCLVGVGGLIMDDMGARRVGDGRYTNPAVIQAATGAEHEVAMPAAVSGAILALGVSVTLAVARHS
jgi:hypothetical protein